MVLSTRPDRVPEQVAAAVVQPRIEIRALTGLRAVAAVWVVLVHFQGALSDSIGGYLAPFWPILSTGWLGVDLFFVLSGFVITLSYIDTMGPRWDTRLAVRFLWARIARVWPLWALLTLGMFTFLAVTGWSSGGPPEYEPHVDLPSLLEQLAMVQMWHRDLNMGSSFIGPGWSLSVEMTAYVAFPLVVLVLFRLRRLPAWVLATLAVAAMAPLALLAYQTGEFNFLLPWPLRIAGAFVAGSLTYLFVRRVRASEASRRIAARVAVAAAVEIGLVCYWSSLRVLNGAPDQSGVAVLCFPVLVGALAMSTTGLSRFLSRETMVLGGRISYSLYLVHLCVLEFASYLHAHVPTLGTGAPAWALLEANVLPLSILLAYLGWRYVEEPGRRFLKDRGPGRLQVRPAPAPVVPDRAAPELAVTPVPALAATPAPVRPRPSVAASPHPTTGPVVPLVAHRFPLSPHTAAPALDDAPTTRLAPVPLGWADPGAHRAPAARAEEHLSHA